jgi:hypothetical protein
MTEAGAHTPSQGPPPSPTVAAAPARALDPISGEVVELAERDTADLAAWRDRLLELKRVVDNAAVELDREMTKRLDMDNCRSVEVGDWRIETQSPVSVEWDAARLGIALEALVAQGRLTKAAALEALEKVVTWKPSARRLEQLRRHADSVVREAVEGCRTESVRERRRVTVKRTHQKLPRLAR